MTLLSITQIAALGPTKPVLQESKIPKGSTNGQLPMLFVRGVHQDSDPASTPLKSILDDEPPVDAKPVRRTKRAKKVKKEKK